MGTVFSSLKNCLNNFFSKSSKKISKDEFNIKLISPLENRNIQNNINNIKNSKFIPLSDMSDSQDKNFPISPQNSKDKYKDEYQNKEFKSKITIDDFQIVKVLGTGAFGKVSLVYNEELKRYFAMKSLKKEYIKKYQQTKHTKEERKIMEKIDYPFINKLYYAFQTKKSLFMITEFMAGGEMFHHLHECGHFDENRTRFYIAELVLAIDHLHKNNILYRDLKPENILLDEIGHIKLTDFGLSKIMNNIEKDKTYTVCGTPIYVAPEVLSGTGYNKLVDWWSLGVLLYEFLAGYSPFREMKNRIDLNIYKRKLKQDPLISDTAFDLIKKLCQTNVEERLGKNVKDIKNHKFFEDIDWVKLEKKQITPPFKPKIRYQGDVRNFDKMFTDMPINSTLGNKDQTMNTLSTRNSKNTYINFTYLGDKVKK